MSGNGTRSRHAGNGNFTINVNRNSTDSIRTGTITISAQGGPTRTITVRQRRATLSVTPATTWRPEPLVESSRDFTVSTNSNALWRVSTESGSWLRIRGFPREPRGDGTFRIIAQPNTGSSERTGTIIVSVQGAPPQRITVTQRPGPSRAQERASCRELSRRARTLMDMEGFDQNAWNNATPAGREDMLHLFYAILNEILDTTPRHNLRFRYSATGSSGAYDRRTRLITINTRYLQNSSDELEMEARRVRVLNTVIHEARHEFQHQAVLDHSRFTVSLETRNHWQRNMNNYILLSSGNSSAFYTQPIEWDAFNFQGDGERIRRHIRAGVRPEYEGSWPWYE